MGLRARDQEALRGVWLEDDVLIQGPGLPGSPLVGNLDVARYLFRLLRRFSMR